MGLVDLVVLDLPPGPEFLAALQRAWSTDAAVAPLDPAAPPSVRRRLLELLRPTAIDDGASVTRLPGGERVAADIAAVIATSGSSGAPKLVELSHAALTASAEASLERLGATSADRWLCCLPTHHVAGLQVLVRAGVLGTEPVVLPRFDPGVLATTEATMTALVPTMLTRLLDDGVDLSRYRAVLVGGSATSATLLARARAAGAPIVTTYGMTETSGGCVYDGVPLAGAEVRIDEGGRIVVRGPMLASGYRDDPTRRVTDAEGWLRTADHGRWDAAGRLIVVGRVDAVIVTGGENVDGEAVAAVLQTHPQVAEAVVVGRDDPEWGQRVVAVCVPADPARPPTLDEVRAHVSATLGRQAAPRQLVLTEKLPRTELGKLQRGELPLG